MKNIQKFLCFLILFFCLSIVPAMANSLNVELPSNLPNGVSVGVTIAKTSITMSFKNTTQTSYSLILDKAIFVDENNVSYKLMHDYGLNNYIQGLPIASKSIGNYTRTFAFFPIENNRTSLGYGYYEKRELTNPFFGAYSYQVPILGNKSVLKNKNFALIIPCQNNSDYTIQNLVFKFNK